MKELSVSDITTDELEAIMLSRHIRGLGAFCEALQRRKQSLDEEVSDLSKKIYETRTRIAKMNAQMYMALKVGQPWHEKDASEFHDEVERLFNKMREEPF